MFKEMNLSQENAQKLVDTYIEQTRAAQEAPYQAYADMIAGWKTQVAEKYGASVEPGGANAVAVSRLLAQLGPAEAPFRAAMDETGVGSHPAFVDAFVSLAKLLGEGDHVRGNNPSPFGQTQSGAVERPSAAAAMYPHLPSAGR
jgi:hypothetical protein